jgi:hypothetical protein
MKSMFSEDFKANEAEFKNLIALSRNLLNDLVDDEERAKEIVDDLGDDQMNFEAVNDYVNKDNKVFATIDD